MYNKSEHTIPCKTEGCNVLGSDTNQAQFSFQALCITLMKILAKVDIVSSNSEMKCYKSPETATSFIA